MAQLPEELLEAIFTNLQPNPSEQYWTTISDENRACYATLAAICRATKAYSRIAALMLYHSVELASSITERPKTGQQASSTEPRLLILLKTCLRRPDFALQIQRLKVQAPTVRRNPLSQWQNSKHHPLISESYDTLFEHIPLCNDLRLTLLNALGRDSEDAGLAILLFLAKNLEHLEYTVGFPFTKRCILEVNERQLPHTLPSLHTLAVSSASTPLRLSHIEPFFCIPTLRTVKAYGFHASTNWNPTYPCCESVQRLQIHQGGFDAQGLEQLFRCFPNLQELEVEVIGTTLHGRHGHITTLSPGIVSEMLRQYPMKLEKLHLVVRNTREEQMAPHCAHSGRLAPLGDTRSLERLRELTTSVYALVGNEGPYFPSRSSLPLVETLPSSLEVLRVVENCQHLDGTVAKESDDADLEACLRFLHKRVSQLCEDARFERLSRVELLDSAAPAEHGVWAQDWTTVYGETQTVLTRDS